MKKFNLRKMIREELRNILMETGISLDDLRGGVQFIPKFFGGKSFIIKDNKVYKRGPHKSENFVEIRVRDMISELGLSGSSDVVKAIQYYGGDMKKLQNNLRKIKELNYKIIR